MIPNYSLFLELLGFTFPFPRIPCKEHNIAKLDMFCWKDEETPAELGLRETAVLSHSTFVVAPHVLFLCGLAIWST